MPNAVKPALLAARDRTRTFARQPGTRRWGKGILIFLVILGLLGFFAAPPLIRSAAERALSKTLLRPVTITKISLNPYTLALEAHGLRVAERGESATSKDFVTLGRLRVRPSWSSLFRGKPIIAEVLIDSLHVNVVRTAEQQFNFSDIAEALTKPSAEPETKPSKPLLFSVSNIRVENTSLDFDDRVLNERHSLSGLRIGLPFVANIPSEVEVFVQPLLEASIDGSPFSISGQAKPFSTTLESSVAIKLDQLKLAELLAYSPLPLAVKLPSANLSTDLRVQFQRIDGEPKVGISGTVDLTAIKVTDAADQPLFEAQRIHLAADSIEPLKQIVHLAELRIEHPVLTASRDKQGLLNLSRLAPTESAPKPVADTKATPTPAAEIPDVKLSNFTLSQGAVHFKDLAAGSGAQFDVEPLEITANALSTRATTPLTYRIAAKLAQGGDVLLEGSAIVPERKLDSNLSVDALALPALQPYLDAFLTARVTSGGLSLKMQAKVDAHEAAPAIQIGPGEISVQDLKVIGPRKRVPALTLGHVAVQVGLVDLAAQQAQLSSLDVDRLTVNAERAADGQIDLAQWLRTSKPAPAATSAKTPAWRYSIDRIGVSQSALSLNDLSNAAPVAVTLSALAVKTGSISDDERKPIQAEVSGVLQRKGRFAVRGAVTRAPLLAALNVKGSDLDIAAFAPYFASNLNASIASALLTLSGDANVAQSSKEGEPLKAAYKGDIKLSKLRLLDRNTSEPFAGFRELSLSKIKAGFDSSSGPDIDIGRIALSDFFAQVLLDAAGQLNVGQVMAGPAQARPVAPGDAGATSTTATPLPGPVVTNTEAPPATPQVAAVVTITPATAPANTTPSPPLKLHIGEIVLAGGNIDYSDNFIKPNFRANLTDFGGSIGAFGSTTADSAPVDLKARLNASGPVRISGTMNPLAATPTLDITANASEIELTRFAAYSAKYTGYPIIKGKLQVDLHYALKDGALNANNHIFIDQFTFGDRVESPSATSLPVRLAISLLKNSRGEIDIDVPVSGSLSDPQFSVGGVIWRAFLNLLQKAVTSPFSLMAGAFGGGSSADELGNVQFAAGSALLDDGQKAKLDKLAKVLTDRPALKLDLVGNVDAMLDAPALRQASVERQVKQQKIKDSVGKGESVDIESITVVPAEYEKYLTRAYNASDLKKPRNAVGLAKTLPPEEMKTLLANHASANDGDLLALAERRASAVQQWLDGKLDAGRIFVVAPKLDAAPAKDGATKTSVDFTLRD